MQKDFELFCFEMFKLWYFEENRNSYSPTENFGDGLETEGFTFFFYYFFELIILTLESIVCDDPIVWCLVL
jgi:hypothetical protein